jgi:hypothetical protein
MEKATPEDHACFARIARANAALGDEIQIDSLGPRLAVFEAAPRAAGWTVRRADAEGELLRLRHPEHGIAGVLVAGERWARFWDVLETWQRLDRPSW